MASVEVCVIAAEDLKEVSLLGKMSPYAVAWVEAIAKQRSPPVKKGGSRPVWSDREKSTMLLQVDLANPYACLTLQIRAKSGARGEAIVGTAWLPLHEIARLCALRGDDDANEGSVITLALQRPSGRLQGVVRLAIRLLGAAHVPRIPRIIDETSGSSSSTTTSYCDAQQSHENKYHGNNYYYHQPSAAVGAAAAADFASPLEPVEGIPVYYNAVPPPQAAASYQFLPSAPPMPAVPPRRQANGGNGLLLGILGGLLGAIILGDMLL